MLFNLPLGVLLIYERLSDRAISPVEVWRPAVLYALLLAVGAFGSLYGAHAILAARKVCVRIPGADEKDSGVNAKSVPG
jgi:hypothetical protein